MKFPYLPKFGVLFIVLTVLFFSACNPENSSDVNKVDGVIAAVKENYAPDKRVALFDIQSEKKSSGYILKGKTNLPEALDALKKRVGFAKYKVYGQY